jgi:hypothetical protein
MSGQRSESAKILYGSWNRESLQKMVLNVSTDVVWFELVSILDAQKNGFGAGAAAVSITGCE